MFSLVAGFVVRMNKRAPSAQGKTTPGSRVPGGKHSKRSGPEEEA